MRNIVRTSIALALFLASISTLAIAPAFAQQVKNGRPTNQQNPNNQNITGQYTPTGGWSASFGIITIAANGNVVASGGGSGHITHTLNTNLYTLVFGRDVHHLAFELGRGFIDSGTGALTLAVR